MKTRAFIKNDVLYITDRLRNLIISTQLITKQVKLGYLLFWDINGEEKNKVIKFIVKSEFFVANLDLSKYHDFFKLKLDFLFEHPLHQISLQHLARGSGSYFEFALYIVDEEGELDLKETKYHCFNERGFVLKVMQDDLWY